MISTQTQSATDQDHLFSPIKMMEVELSRPLPAVAYDGSHHRVWVLARLHTEPIGASILRLGVNGLSANQLARELWPELKEALARRFVSAGRPVPLGLDADGLQTGPEPWPFLLSRSEVLRSPPFISVVICTRDRVDQLQACLLNIARQEYPKFEVVVVDNAEINDKVRTVVESMQDAKFRCVAEPRAGLSRARNAGVAAASGEIVAFIDDDEAPDVHWLAEIARGFARGDDIGGVTGMILPARLDTEAQVLFEEHGGHVERGFSPAIFSRHDPQSPLYPLPPFGAGGNMAFRRRALRAIGEFDVSLGAGTQARGGEDTLALTLLLLSGYRIAYEPAAFVRHDHYSGFDGLGRQLRGYGVGLTAFYTALLWHRPRVLLSLLKLMPLAVRYLRHTGPSPAVTQRDPYPELLRHRRRGMLAGPVAYLRGIARDGWTGRLGTRRSES